MPSKCAAHAQAQAHAHAQSQSQSQSQDDAQTLLMPTPMHTAIAIAIAMPSIGTTTCMCIAPHVRVHGHSASCEDTLLGGGCANLPIGIDLLTHLGLLALNLPCNEISSLESALCAATNQHDNPRNHQTIRLYALTIGIGLLARQLAPPALAHHPAGHRLAIHIVRPSQLWHAGQVRQALEEAYVRQVLQQSLAAIDVQLGKAGKY
jgi:hypothetical protein